MMILERMNEQYKRITNAIMDEESKKIFDSRIEYMITRNEERFEEALFDEKKDYYCLEIDSVLQGSGLDIVIFGVGKYGRKTNKNLSYCHKYVVKAYCDNDTDLIGEKIDDLPVLSPNDIVDDNSIIVVASQKYGEEMYNQLIGLGVDKNRIVTPVMGYLEIQCGWQYFDLFKPMQREIFIDAGTFDGTTIIDFNRWLGKTTGFAYGMEPVREMYEVAIRRLQENKITNAKIYECAAWNCNEKVNIRMDVKADGEIWGGSRISEDGAVTIKGKTIDTLLEENESNVTFIKMDIEGSELKALEGAANSIKIYQPRLAISLYHKPEDVLEIPTYILGLNPKYKLYLRHYTGDCNETVLYATL